MGFSIFLYQIISVNLFGIFWRWKISIKNRNWHFFKLFAGTPSEPSNHQQFSHQHHQSQPHFGGPTPGSPNKAEPARSTETVNIISPQALAMLQQQQQQYQRHIQQLQLQLQQQQQVQRPLFLSLPAEPPKVKRALHSEVFLR